MPDDLFSGFGGGDGVGPPAVRLKDNFSRLPISFSNGETSPGREPGLSDLDIDLVSSSRFSCIESLEEVFEPAIRDSDKVFGGIIFLGDLFVSKCSDKSGAC